MNNSTNNTATITSDLQSFNYIKTPWTLWGATLWEWVTGAVLALLTVLFLLY